MSNRAKKTITDKISSTVLNTVKKGSTNADVSAAQPISNDLIDAIVPMVVNATNNEPWYKSRVTLGAYLTIFTFIVGRYGYNLPTELHGPILDIIGTIGPVIGAALSLYGRWWAKKPILE